MSAPPIRLRNVSEITSRFQTVDSPWPDFREVIVSPSSVSTGYDQWPSITQQQFGCRMHKNILVLFVAFATPLLANAQDGPNRRIVFNDDAQVLMECPATGTSKFIKHWLDREVATVPFNTYVFQSALPDICNFETKAWRSCARTPKATTGPDVASMIAPSKPSFHRRGSLICKIVGAFE